MKNFKNLCIFLNLDYKKEMTKIVVILIASILISSLLVIFNKMVAINIIFLIAVVVINYLYISRYSSYKQSLLKERENEFISIISYFKIFITNNFNVYSSFESLLPYCSNWMKEAIGNLLKNIDEDKSVQPFVDFARLFNNTIIENVMISIYQMIDEGENVHSVSQFSLLFNEFAKNNEENAFDKKVKSLESLNTFPLIGAAAITIILTFGIFSIIGDLINVI